MCGSVLKDQADESTAGVRRLLETKMAEIDELQHQLNALQTGEMHIDWSM